MDGIVIIIKTNSGIELRLLFTEKMYFQLPFNHVQRQAVVTQNRREAVGHCELIRIELVDVYTRERWMHPVDADRNLAWVT